MTKILPVNSIKPTEIKTIAKSVTKPLMSSAMTAVSAIGATGLVMSTFIKDFNKTSDEDNYFQFKINPDTGKHYEADIFQKAAAMNLYLGNDVLVTAPTGTGKTAIAEYVITKNLKEGHRTFYTTPLKALSNEKFLDFCKIYGEENVGLLTGDTKVNTEAPVIIMTTEVYRNMAAGGKFNFDNEKNKGIPSNVKTVIFDELQYLGDVDRGGIWEQSIMFTPKNIQMLSLSATIGNNEEINNWMASIKGNKAVAVTPQKGYLPDRTEAKETVLINVPSENRHVPLNFEIMHAAAEIKVPRGGSKKEKIRAKQEGARKSQSIYAQPRDEVYKTLTKKLKEEGKIPAIYFVFSKKESRHLLKYLSNESEILTDEKEQREIVKIIQKYIDDGVYLGESLDTNALIKGYAVHNAGLLPSQKTLIEELFQKKLVKVVIATETLSAGINMPAKTTVISSPRKPASTSDGGNDRKRNLTANEFHQMAGRAGRRGIDTEGCCIVISCNPVQNKFYEDLIKSPSNPLISSMDLDYSFITNYMSEFFDEHELRRTLSKSLYSYNPEGGVNEDKLDELMNRYHIRREILQNARYIDEQGNLTIKGELIKTLNGYEQIPIINLIHNKVLEKLNPAQIAGVIGGLANIEYDTRGEFPQKPFELKSIIDGDFNDAAFRAFMEVKDYDRKTSELYPGREINISTKVMEHLYTWAELNTKEQDSRKNWKEIFSGDMKYSVRDEGSLFKEINMTVDLLKQLCDAAIEGEKYATTEEDRDYYYAIGQKFKDTIELLQKEPIGK